MIPEGVFLPIPWILEVIIVITACTLLLWGMNRKIMFKSHLNYTKATTMVHPVERGVRCKLLGYWIASQ